jgi:hypothetical protein
MKVTVESILGLNLCEDYREARLNSLKSGLGGSYPISLVEVCDMKLPTADILLAVSKLLPDSESRQFGCDCLESVKHLEPDETISLAIRSARSYTIGLINEEDLYSISFRINHLAVNDGLSDAPLFYLAASALLKLPLADSPTVALYAVKIARKYSEQGVRGAAISKERRKQLSMLRDRCEKWEVS